jgi:hypothetical protein
MPLEPEELTPDAKLYKMIEKVVIIRGTIPSNPTTWEFHIQGKVLKVDTDCLESMKQFRQQYLKAFDRPAPKIKLSRWPSLLEALADDKAIYTQAPEESRPVFIASRCLKLYATAKNQTTQKKPFPDLHYINTFSKTMKKSITVCRQKFS